MAKNLIIGQKLDYWPAASCNQRCTGCKWQERSPEYFAKSQKNRSLWNSPFLCCFWCCCKITKQCFFFLLEITLILCCQSQRNVLCSWSVRNYIFAFNLFLKSQKVYFLQNKNRCMFLKNQIYHLFCKIKQRLPLICKIAQICSKNQWGRKHCKSLQNSGYFVSTLLFATDWGDSEKSGKGSSFIPSRASKWFSPSKSQKDFPLKNQIWFLLKKVNISLRQIEIYLH